VRLVRKRKQAGSLSEHACRRGRPATVVLNPPRGHFELTAFAGSQPHTVRVHERRAVPTRPASDSIGLLIDALDLARVESRLSNTKYKIRLHYCN
jgi:hypothetical protein